MGFLFLGRKEGMDVSIRVYSIMILVLQALTPRAEEVLY